MNYTFQWGVALEHLPGLLDGAKLTFIIGFLTFWGASFVGLVMAALKTYGSRIAQRLVGAYVIFFTNTPALVQIWFLYFGLPDVGIVWGHRTPLRAIASMCSMTRTLMKTRLDLEPRKLGPLVMDFYATSLDRGLAARERLDRARFIDVTHDDFVSDSMGTVERIYRHFGLDLGGEARAAMEARVTSHPKDQHGRHDYGLVEFGLTVEEVEERFAPYVERFQLSWK